MPLVKSLISSTKNVQPLTYICNKSCESGIFPDEMNISKFVPLFKNGYLKDFPIMDLCQFCLNFQNFLENYFITD